MTRRSPEPVPHRDLAVGAFYEDGFVKFLVYYARVMHALPMEGSLH
jgi:hypothetical protein